MWWFPAVVWTTGGSGEFTPVVERHCLHRGLCPLLKHWPVSQHTSSQTNIVQTGTLKVIRQTPLVASWHTQHRLICHFDILLQLEGHLKCSKLLRYVHLAFTQHWPEWLYLLRAKENKTHPPVQAHLQCSVVWWRSSINFVIILCVLWTVCRCCLKSYFPGNQAQLKHLLSHSRVYGSQFLSLIHWTSVNGRAGHVCMHVEKPKASFIILWPHCCFSQPASAGSSGTAAQMLLWHLFPRVWVSAGMCNTSCACKVRDFRPELALHLRPPWEAACWNGPMTTDHNVSVRLRFMATNVQINTGVNVSCAKQECIFNYATQKLKTIDFFYWFLKKVLLGISGPESLIPYLSHTRREYLWIVWFIFQDILNIAATKSPLDKVGVNNLFISWVTQVI